MRHFTFNYIQDLTNTFTLSSISNKFAWFGNYWFHIIPFALLKYLPCTFIDVNHTDLPKEGRAYVNSFLSVDLFWRIFRSSTLTYLWFLSMLSMPLQPPWSSATSAQEVAPSCTRTGGIMCVCASLTALLHSRNTAALELPEPPSPHEPPPVSKWVKGKRSPDTSPVSFCVSFITADFARLAVDISAVVFQSEGQTPCACCVVCPSSGTRTVVLYDT